ncbi:MAG: type I phosphomannose isomerase catalytic subunit [Phycisphaerales bacterium]
MARPANPKPYPLLLEPILMEKVWGGRRLALFGKRLPPEKPIGECWEVADLAGTSPSGGGGQAARSVITGGALAGRTLHDALELWGADLLGPAKPSPDGGYPLLVKFLDARENLSIQVHPSPAYAAAHPGAHLKTECWYILSADPGSVIYKGVRPGITRARFAADIERGAVVDDLTAVPAIPGECHTLPSGTVHALGTGVLVAEVQTPSDTTFRVFDWGRAGRELHIAEALECIDFAPAPPATRWDALESRARGTTLAKTPSFTVAEVETRDHAGEACDVLIAIRGRGRIAPAPRAAFPPIDLAPGATIVFPRALDGQWSVEPTSEELRYLAVSLAGPA